jgi:hypothetical protein
LGSAKSGMITRRICTGMGKLMSVRDCFCLPGLTIKRFLARLKMSNATPLGRWRGFKLRYDGGSKVFVYVTPLHPSSNFIIASTSAKNEGVLSWILAQT